MTNIPRNGAETQVQNHGPRQTAVKSTRMLTLGLLLAFVSSGCATITNTRMLNNCLRAKDPNGKVLLDPKVDDLTRRVIFNGHQNLCTDLQQKIIQQDISTAQPNEQLDYERFQRLVADTYNPRVEYKVPKSEEE